MLRPLLNAETVGSHALKALMALRLLADAPARPDAVDPVAARDIAASLQALASLGGGKSGSARDSRAFVNSNPHLSLLQALLEEAAHTARFAARDVGVGDAPARAVALPGTEQTSLQRHTLARQPTASGSAPAEEQFGAHDIRWLEVVVEMARAWRKRVAYALPDDPAPFALAPDARIVLVSDWGNGSEAANSVARHIAEWVRSAYRRQCHVIHLGDTYYAGTPWESRNRFLAAWPVPANPAALFPAPFPARSPVPHPAISVRDGCYSWVLAGNHDMYSAGEGLEAVLSDPRFAQQLSTAGSPTTRFLLRNDEIQLVGLDTSWKFDLLDPCNLHGQLGAAQAEWLAQQVSAAANTILLTHHQPISRRRPAPEPVATEDRMLAETEPARAGSGLAAWFWGHEHRCMTFDAPPAVPGLAFGACTGHGAMPELVPNPPIATGPGEWEYTAAQPADAYGDIWRRCGFTVLDLNPGAGTPTVQFVDQDGSPCREPVQLSLNTARR